jgi:lactoylglutathione lyase
MATRAFPVIYASDVGKTARFWERLGFTRFYQLPAEGDPGYVGLRRGSSELAVTAAEWPRQQYALRLGDGPRFEMYVYVDDVDEAVARLRAEAVQVLKDPRTTVRYDAGPRPPRPACHLYRRHLPRKRR